MDRVPDGGGAEADFVYRKQRLIVEVDGRGFHATNRAFQTDRRRDQRLMRAPRVGDGLEQLVGVTWLSSSRLRPRRRQRGAASHSNCDCPCVT